MKLAINVPTPAPPPPPELVLELKKDGEDVALFGRLDTHTQVLLRITENGEVSLPHTFFANGFKLSVHTR